MRYPDFPRRPHGTAVVNAAGIINAMRLTGRDLKEQTAVVAGAGARGSPARSF
jgi:malic enzyme